MGDIFTLDWAWGLFSYTAALLAGVYLVARKLPKRNYFYIRIAVCIAVFIGESFAFRTVQARVNEWLSFLPATYFIPFLIQYFMAIFAVWACFRCNIWASLFSATVGYCMQHISQRLFQICLRRLLLSDVLKCNPYTVISLTLFTCILYYLTNRFMFDKIERELNDIVVDNKFQICASVIVCATTNIGVAFLVGGGTFDVFSNNILDLLSCLIAVTIFLLQISILRAKKLETDMMKLEQMLSEKHEQLENERKNMELVNVKAHDLRHQLNVYKDRIDSGALSEMNKIIDEYQGYIKTGNESLDLILTKESMACLKENIRFTAMLNGENFSFFQPHELYALFGNAIENAIHAVKKLPPEKRIIAVNETVAEGFTTVHFINYYDGNLKLDKDGLPVTEQEKNYHGFGVKSIRMLAEKYDGRLRLDVLDDVFQLNIFFPIQSDSLSRSFIPNNGKVA